MEAIRALIRRVLDSLKEYWQSQERNVKVRFIIVAGIALIGIIVAVVLMTRVEYVVLFDTDVSASDIGAAQTALTSAGIRNRTQDGRLLVDQRQEYAAVNEMTRLQIPAGGYDYSLLERASGFGISETERSTWIRMQAQEDLNKKLAESPKVKSARVDIAQPNNDFSLYNSEKSPVTASVLLNLNEPLTSDEVDGIVGVVAYAYPDLNAQNIVVTDQYMNILNRGEPTDISQVTQQHEYERIVEADLNRNLLSQFQIIFGVDHVRVNTKATISFDDKSTEKITRTPVNEEDMEGIKVSQRRVVEKATGASSAGAVPGVDENGWDIPDYPETANTGSTWSHLTEEINWEFNEQIDKIEEAKGKLVDLSVAITIDSNGLADENQSVRDIQTIAAGAMGLSQSDYNRISVSFMRFAGLEEQKALEDQMREEMRRREIQNFILSLIPFIILGSCLILLIVLIYRFFHKPESEDELLQMQQLANMEELDEYADLLKLTATGEDLEAVKSPERMKIEDFIDRNPEMVANLLRNWLSEETPRGRR